MQSSNNKQGSSGLLQDEEWVTANHTQDSGENYAEHFSSEEALIHEEINDFYATLLDAGVAKEQARKILPLSTYTMAYWKVDLHNLLHFLSLRLDPHAQLEIREYSDIIWQMVQDWVPHTAEAFKDYRLDAMYLSGAEARAVRYIVAGGLGVWDVPDPQDATPEDYAAVTLFDLKESQRLGEFFERFGIESKRDRAEFLKKLGVI